MHFRRSNSHSWAETVMLCRTVRRYGRHILHVDAKSLCLDFVGYWPPKKTVIVAYEGTDPLVL